MVHGLVLALHQCWSYKCMASLSTRLWSAGITKKGIMKLRQFQGLVAQGLIEVGMCRKRGRPSLDEESAPEARRLVRVEPCQDVRFDQIGHWPEKGDKCRRCAVCNVLRECRRAFLCSANI